MKLTWNGTPARSVRFNEKGTINQVNILKHNGTTTWVRGYKIIMKASEGKVSCWVNRTSSPFAKASTSTNESNKLNPDSSYIYYGDTVRISLKCTDTLNDGVATLTYTYANGDTRTEDFKPNIKAGGVCYGTRTLQENNLVSLTIAPKEVHVVGWHSTSGVYLSSITGTDNGYHSEGSGYKCNSITTYVDIPNMGSQTGRIRISDGCVTYYDSGKKYIYCGRSSTADDEVAVEFTSSNPYVAKYPVSSNGCTKCIEVYDARSSSTPNRLMIITHTLILSGRLLEPSAVDLDIQVYY